MRGQEYSAVVEQLTPPLNATAHIELIARQYELAYDELATAFAQEAQATAIHAHAWVRQHTPELVDRYTEGESLVELAWEAECPPCLLARRLLESMPCLEGRQRSTHVLRNPSMLARQPGEPGSDKDAGAEGIVQRLQEDIVQAAQLDTLYSPQSDVIRHALGLEYEAILYEKLRNADVQFVSEDVLRGQGFFKTPDAKLEIPVLINGRVVNWIDSKATFGSQQLHAQQREMQYEKYINRFGPGAVIYWFGLVEEVAAAEQDLLLLSSFPRDIVQLPRLPRVQKKPVT